MLWRRVAIGVGAIVALLLVVLVGGYVWLDTRSGHAFVQRQLAALILENGLNIRVGRIEGSIYGDTVLKDVRFRDPKGDFARSPEIRLDWHPFAYLGGAVDIDALTAKQLDVLRLPAFSPVPDRGEPLLPDLDIGIDRLKIDRIVFAEAITGKQQIASLEGKVRIADRRAVVDATGGTLEGDRLVLKLDAVPDDNRFDVDMKLSGPADGLVAGLAGKEVPIAATLAGRGSWQKWDGAFAARAGEERVADLALNFPFTGNLSWTNFFWITLNPEMDGGPISLLCKAD